MSRAARPGSSIRAGMPSCPAYPTCPSPPTRRSLDRFGARGGRKPEFDRAARPWYSWMRPPSRSRRRTSRGLTWIGSPGRCDRWGEAEGAMRAPAVVVLGIDAQRSIEMPPTEDERPVEALGPHRLDPPFRVGVGVRCLDRGADDPHPLRAQHRVEWPAELRVPVADEEPEGR